MFEKEEAFAFVKNFLQVENAESRMKKDKRAFLDEIAFNIQSKIPFQNISLLSAPPSKRRRPTQDEIKSNFVSGIGGLCFDLNTCVFHLLSSLGFDVDMVHVSVSTSLVFHKGHMMLVVNDVEQDGDRFLFDTAGGCPQPRTISLDFEKESPIYIDAYLEYKFIKMDDGKLLRMHRKGDGYAARGRQENSNIEFWIDDWRRFYTADLTVTTKDPSTFDEYYQDVYVNPKASPFHLSHRLVHFPGGKAAMVINDKTMIQNDEGRYSQQNKVM